MSATGTLILQCMITLTYEHQHLHGSIGYVTHVPVQSLFHALIIVIAIRKSTYQWWDESMTTWWSVVDAQGSRVLLDDPLTLNWSTGPSTSSVFLVNVGVKMHHCSKNNVLSCRSANSPRLGTSACSVRENAWSTWVNDSRPKTTDAIYRLYKWWQCSM